MEKEHKGRKKRFDEESVVLSIRVPKSKLAYYKNIIQSMLLAETTKK